MSGPPPNCSTLWQKSSRHLAYPPAPMKRPWSHTATTRSASVGPQIQNHLSSIASAKEENSKFKNPSLSPSASCIRKMTLRIHQNGVKRTKTDTQFHPMSSPRQTLEQPGTAETAIE